MNLATLLDMDSASDGDRCMGNGAMLFALAISSGRDPFYPVVLRLVAERDEQARLGAKATIRYRSGLDFGNAEKIS